MNRIILSVGLLFLILTAACSISPAPTVTPTPCPDVLGCVRLAPDEPMRFSVLQVISGETAVLGLTQWQAIELAANDYDNQILGHPIELTLHDTYCTQEGGANAVLRAVADPQTIGILGTACSAAAVGAAPIMSDAGLVMVSGLNTAPSLTSIRGVRGEDWYAGYYRVLPNGLWSADIAADFAYNRLKLQRVGTINDNDPFSRGLSQAFEERFTAIGGEVVISVTINRGDTDMQPLMDAVSMAQPDMLFMPIFQPEGDAIVLQSAAHPELDTLTFMSVQSLFTPAFVENVRETVVGRMYFTEPRPIESNTLDGFNRRYENAYGPPAHSGYVYGYEAANLLFHAVEQVAQLEADGTLIIPRQALRDALDNTRNFPGVTGRITCDAFGDCAARSFGIYQMARPDDTMQTVRINRVGSYANIITGEE